MTRFAPDPRRRAMIGKIKVAQKQLRMAQDDYTALLIRVAAVDSSTKASINGLEAIINEMKLLGFVALPAKGSSKPRKAPLVSTPPARKARALWISLHQLGVVRDGSERALEAFVKKQMKIEAFAWANDGQMYKVIEALKNMAERNGWSQDTKMANDASHALQILKMNLCRAIIGKLRETDLVPEAWSVGVAAHRLLGIETQGSPMSWGVETLDAVARGLADILAGKAKVSI